MPTDEDSVRKSVPSVATPSASEDCWVVAIAPLPTPACAGGHLAEHDPEHHRQHEPLPEAGHRHAGRQRPHAQVRPVPQKNVAASTSRPAAWTSEPAVTVPRPHRATARGPSSEAAKNVAHSGDQRRARPPAAPKRSPSCIATASTNMKPPKPTQNGTISSSPLRTLWTRTSDGGSSGLPPARSPRISTADERRRGERRQRQQQPTTTAASPPPGPR